MSVQSVPLPAKRPFAVSGFHVAFVVAWAFCLLFYFMQYAVRSAPSVMLPELTAAFGLTTLGVSSLVGLYYYTYSAFAIVAGASLDRWGAKYTIPVGVFFLAVGIVMFGMGISWAANIGRLLQGAGAAFAFVGAVYLATHGFPAALSRDRDRLYAVLRHAGRLGRAVRCRSVGAWSDQLATVLDLLGRGYLSDRDRNADLHAAPGRIRTLQDQYLAHV
jgi:Major Facilitator Superfamily